jgi:hypothetical protein
MNSEGMNIRIMKNEKNEKNEKRPLPLDHTFICILLPAPPQPTTKVKPI